MKVSIITANGRTEFENDSIENVRALVEQVGPALGLTSAGNLAVNGQPASDDTPLADGDEVTTTKPAGRKGR